jgi:hypothetical protein
MDDKDKQFVDALLDASLRRYVHDEPRPGLEGRILAGVRPRQQDERRRKSLFWIVGMATAAAVVVMLAMSWSHRRARPAPITANVPAIVSSPTVAKIIPPVQEPMRHKTVHHAMPSRADSRPQQFPTPRPLSEQEKLLVEYAELIKNSPGAIKPDVDQDSQGDLEIPPLSIAAITIEPLPTTGNADDK